MKVYQVDAFTNQVFGGNYAAVVPLEQWLEDEILLKIAQENNYPETAFFIKRENHFDLRWFTPAYEMDLCGHATLASAHVIFQHLNYDKNEISFSTMSGFLHVSKQNDWYTMDFPARSTTPMNISPMLIKALGAEPLEAYLSNDILVVFEKEEDILNIQPDFKTCLALEGRGIIATAKGKHSDFVSRFFAPKAGIDEDPVTGSAHCILTPFWSDRLNKKELHAFQVSERRGELKCVYLGERVLISGQAVTYLIGEIFI